MGWSIIVLEDSLHPGMNRKDRKAISRKFRKMVIIASPFNDYLESLFSEHLNLSNYFTFFTKSFTRLISTGLNHFPAVLKYDPIISESQHSK